MMLLISETIGNIVLGAILGAKILYKYYENTTVTNEGGGGGQNECQHFVEHNCKDLV